MKLSELFGDLPAPSKATAPSQTVVEHIENECTDKIHKAIEQVVEALILDAHGVDGTFHFKSEHNSQSGNICRYRGEGNYHLGDNQDAERAVEIVEENAKEIADQIEECLDHDEEYSHVKAKISGVTERAHTVVFKYEVQIVKE